MSACAFCGSSGRLTREHVFGRWLSRIGLDATPVARGAGRLNRALREMGVGGPFEQTVREVCGNCNNGWMSGLEVIAQRVLAPMIVGGAGAVAEADAAAVAAWIQKTALTAMLVLSRTDRAAGSGLPPSEYRALWALRDEVAPLPTSRFWIGRYTGARRVASAWVTPLAVTVEGLPVPDRPQGYAMTVLVGQLVLHGVRFTTPSLAVDVTTRQCLPQLWPVAGPTSWPAGQLMGDETFLRLAGGKDVCSTEPGIGVVPWTHATELPASIAVAGMVELPAICGEHVVYYPAVLVQEASLGRFYVFGTACECPKAYLIRTEADGAHCVDADTTEAVEARYEALPGEDVVIEDSHGIFLCKRMTADGMDPGVASA